ncbi:hypothetical protein HYALB_00005062 [Hymenoscyphus albidus]|uniref:Uncharacterized protein n=1 Tax=Hymenoscyphus albidus TaxID=595503 RepID=A0A9N9LTX4_9HELO|nr:hypothetical protein HYALB_00005062 [Hymenoscyphus albidus]
MLEIEAQQKAQAAAKKGGNSILKKDKGMKYQCVRLVRDFRTTWFKLTIIQATCKAEVDNINNMKIHWEAKHPKEKAPADDFASMSKAPATK